MVRDKPALQNAKVQTLLAYFKLLLAPESAPAASQALLRVLPSWPGLGKGAAAALEQEASRARAPGAAFALARGACEGRGPLAQRLTAPQRNALAALLGFIERLRW